MILPNLFEASWQKEQGRISEFQESGVQEFRSSGVRSQEFRSQESVGK